MTEKSYTQKENAGVLFKNDKKGNDKAPTYKGNCKVNGKSMYISAWVNETNSGEKYMSLKFEEPKAKEPEQEPITKDGETDDLPF
jgi:uncharacterized protein (DUF736 family)